jgi:hypothetical protein
MNVGVEESGVWYSCGYPGCLFRTVQSHRMERHSTFHTDTDRYSHKTGAQLQPQSNELTRRHPELVQQFRLQWEFTSAQ